ncbi:MAG: hypothetical protein ACLVK6_02440, partial [Lachnospiraceae bacterium]
MNAFPRQAEFLRLSAPAVFGKTILTHKIYHSGAELSTALYSFDQLVIFAVFSFTPGPMVLVRIALFM